MIQVLPLKESLFNIEDTVKKMKLSKYCYVNSIDLISNLLTIDMPIKNRRKAIINILDFLNNLDYLIIEKETSLLKISSYEFIKYFSHTKYKKYIQILKDLEILINVPYPDGTLYKMNESCKQFRVYNSYLNREDNAIIILENDRSKFEYNNELEDEVDPRYSNTIKALEVNVKSAIEAEILYCKEEGLSEFTLRNRISRIFYTRRRRFLKKGRKVNRIYHSFTNLSKVSRRHLNLHLHNIDIKNCQPLLLVAYLKKNNLEVDTNYQDDCEQANFYEQFVGINNLDRNQVKKQIYKNIFFGFNTKSKFNKRFKELYPLVWEQLRLLKEQGTLASELQNIESELFNNLIPKDSKYFFTLFDAIYFDSVNDIAELNETIHTFFNSLNIKVNVEIE